MLSTSKGSFSGRRGIPYQSPTGSPFLLEITEVWGIDAGQGVIEITSPGGTKSYVLQGCCHQVVDSASGICRFGHTVPEEMTSEDDDNDN